MNSSQRKQYVRTSKMMLTVAAFSLVLSACEQAPSDRDTAKTTSSEMPPVPDEPATSFSKAPPQVASDVASLAPIELSALIHDAMPPEGTEVLDRRGLLNDPIVWIGDDTSSTGGVRITINGTRAISYRTDPPKEMEWVVTVGRSNSADTLASTTIRIPGNLCFNESEKDCTFSQKEAFASPDVKADALCSLPRDNGYKAYFRLTSPGRAPMIASIVLVKDDKTSFSGLELALASSAVIPCGT